MTALRLPAARRSTPAALRTAAAALGAILLAGLLFVAPGGVRADPVDPLGDELMRVTNLDRTALGKAALAIDPVLASFARDLSFACPTDGSLVLRGRSQDMAERDYFSHSIVGCVRSDGSTLSALDIMATVLGYRTTRGENIAWNTYGTAAATYAYGCTIDGTGCVGTTTTPKTVEVAQRGFMRSSGHRANILGGYDRLGCGAALAPDGGRYFTCVFSLGGPPAPTPTPTPEPTPTPPPDTTRPSFVRIAGTAPVSLGNGRTLTATVVDDRALARVAVWLDGRLYRGWYPNGTRATRSVYVPATRLWYGRHTVRWIVRDAAGNTRAFTFKLYVR